MAQWSRICQATQEMQVGFLRGEDPLEKEIMTHGSVLGWEIPWIEELVGLQSMVWQRGGHNLVTKHQQQIGID